MNDKTSIDIKTVVRLSLSKPWLKTEPNDEECDARDDEQNYKSWPTKI